MKPVTGGLLATLCLLVSCTPPVPVRLGVPPPPAPVLQEENVPPVERPEIEILDLQQTPTPDRKRVTLTGTLRNQGNAETHQLMIRIEAQDKERAVVLSADAQPSSDEVPPGGTATFTATVDNRPEVVRYHVEAIAR
jgi:hypothetical protein